MFQFLHFLSREKYTVLLAVLFVVLLGVHQAKTQSSEPDLTVCDGVTCETLPESICSAAGFKITLTDFTPPETSTDGSATYVYEICSPNEGVCEGGTGLRAGEACLENDFCRSKGQDTDPEAFCNRECAVDDFKELSHFDVLFPTLGGLESCLSSETTVRGTCTCSMNNSGNCTVGPFVKGDGSCFDNGNSENFVAKCDNTSMEAGDCISMSLNIAGELTDLGLGAAIVVDKEAQTCTSSCLAGPSCDACDPPPGRNPCLTRTIGFWGNHPWITNDYDPVTVCGYQLGCDDLGSDTSPCSAGSCTSIIEGLCSIPGIEGKRNQSYVTLVRQLTAAKLNLNATSDLFERGTCADFEYDGSSIQEWIRRCERLCDANKSTISRSGCIEALDAFNNSRDTGFEMTPPPFDRPPINDQGVVEGADPSECIAAHGNRGNPKFVIGKKVGRNDCR